MMRDVVDGWPCGHIHDARLSCLVGLALWKKGPEVAGLKGVTFFVSRRVADFGYLQRLCPKQLPQVFFDIFLAHTDTKTKSDYEYADIIKLCYQEKEISVIIPLFN